MLLAPLLLLCSLIPQPQGPSCADAWSCRSAALEAQGRKDFETFHDLAWMAYRKGRPDDPELMLLLARAQSLSGRPGDAMVMLDRLAARGVVTDAATSDDFASVRSLQKWIGAKATSAASPAPSTAPPAATPPPPRSASRRAPGAPLTFTTILTPSALAYDAVSRRFIIADRVARRIAVIDEHTGLVATLVGAQGALGDIGGVAIDPQQGDLWVVSSTSDGAKLHRMQLISGRVLSTTALRGPQNRVVALAFARHVGLVLADASGTIWRVSAEGRSDRLAALEYVPRTLATDSEGRLYVAAGAPRLARFDLSPSMRKIDMLELAPDIPPDAPFVIVGSRLHLVDATGGGHVLRSIDLPKR
ncbi:MAG TPA: hypothetical protein VNJ03_09135 [Vicinamibacterales bacterium]|nr:hypothetical protein [Vicinamibacterales bacterium]